jgi:hypothetical protein
MVNTDYVVREWHTVGGNLVTVTVVDMGGRVHQVTLRRSVANTQLADDLIRAAIIKRHNGRFRKGA